MDFVIEFLFELFGEFVGAIIESDRVPRFVRILVFALIVGPLLFLLFLGIRGAIAGNIYLAIFLGLLAVGLIIGFIYFIYRINRFGVLTLAKKDDLPQILKLYGSVIGQKGCTWDVRYPNEVTLHEDYQAQCLYTLRKGKGIIGAVSIVPENELDDLDCWQITENAREIARIVIAPEHQGKGHGKHMVSTVCAKLEKMGCKAVHILVAKENHHALNLYRNAGFHNKGSCHRYDIDFYAYEKIS